MLDFYDIDSVLSEDERAVRDSVRRRGPPKKVART